MAATATRWLTENQASQRLGIHFSTLWRWRQAGIAPPHYLVNGRARYNLDELQAWLDERREPAK